MKRLRLSQDPRLLLLAATLGLAASANATTIYVNDNWGDAPVSNADSAAAPAAGHIRMTPNDTTSIPRESKIEDRISYANGRGFFVNTITRTGTTATVQTIEAHGLAVGDVIRISGVTLQTGIVAGTFRVTGVPTTTSFTYTTAASGTIAARGVATTGAPANVIGIRTSIINAGTPNKGSIETIKPHGFTTGDSVNFTGLTTNYTTGGPYTITVTSPTTFTFTTAQAAVSFVAYDAVITNAVISVTNASIVANEAILTTNAPHGLGVGQTISVGGALAAPFSGTYVTKAGTTGNTIVYDRTNANTNSTAAGIITYFSVTPVTDDVPAVLTAPIVPTGLENKIYFPINATAGYYEGRATGDVVSTAYGNLTIGTNAFRSIKEATDFIALAGSSGVDEIKILGGTYYEALIIPRNDASAPVAGNVGEYATNFKISGEKFDRPVLTRGIILDNEISTGMVIENLNLQGAPGTAVAASASNGDGNTLNATANGLGSLRIVMLPTSFDLATATATTLGTRRNLTLRNNVLDGQGLRYPYQFGSGVQIVNGSSFSTSYRTGATGGSNGVMFNGILQNLTVENNTFRGLRGFTVVDFQGGVAGGSNTTTYFDEVTFDGNTVEDCWGNFSIRGRQRAGSVPIPLANYKHQVANVTNNSIRDMGEGAFFQGTSSGAAFKIFNLTTLNFLNNSIVRVNVMQNWFALPAGSSRDIPMGAGLIYRDRRFNTETDANNFWTGNPDKYSTINVIGNLFDSCQQGFAIDAGGGAAQSYLPAGTIESNTFINNRTGIYFYDAIFNELQFSIKNNLFIQSSNDPFGEGVVNNANNAPLQGGIVFDIPSQDPGTPNPLDLSGNYFDSPNGPGGDVNGASSGEPVSFITEADLPVPPNIPTTNPAPLDPSDLTGVSGPDTPGGPVDGYIVDYPTLDTDADGLNDAVEPTYGTDINDSDTDNDGLSDGFEVRFGSNPNDGNDPSGIPPAPGEPVYDGNDSDADGLTATVEALLGTSDSNPDSDGDRIRDDYEVLVGTNPTDDGSAPVLGDANGDNAIDNQDYTRILESSIDDSVLAGRNRNQIDVDRNGVVDNVDAQLLFGFFINNPADANSIPYLPF